MKTQDGHIGNETRDNKYFFIHIFFHTDHNKYTKKGPYRLAHTGARRVLQGYLIDYSMDVQFRDLIYAVGYKFCFLKLNLSLGHSVSDQLMVCESPLRF